MSEERDLDRALAYSLIAIIVVLLIVTAEVTKSRILALERRVEALEKAQPK